MVLGNLRQTVVGIMILSTSKGPVKWGEHFLEGCFEIKAIPYLGERC